MKAPGTAYDNPKIGKDRQPADMDSYKKLPNTSAGDWGGVHTNSGIPNRAFYFAATNLGGYSWVRDSWLNFSFVHFSNTKHPTFLRLFFPIY